MAEPGSNTHRKLLLPFPRPRPPTPEPKDSCGSMQHTIITTEAMAENDLIRWTAKQGRILTAAGDALRYYSQENGFPFSPEELPHHYLERGITHDQFMQWARARRRCLLEAAQPTTLDLHHNVGAKILHISPIVGAWDRPLFAGTWEHSTNSEEMVYNIQTGTLFVDLRIPRSRPTAKWERLARSNNSRKVLESMSNMDLRLFARQHAFGGYSMITTEDARRPLPLCTRHHCIDWNYVQGKPRPRPNKWYIESKNAGTEVCDTWKEWSYSTDENGQSYYFERWQRIKGDDDGGGFCLAMRKKEKKNKQDDGILVVVGVSQIQLFQNHTTMHIIFQNPNIFYGMAGSLQLYFRTAMERTREVIPRCLKSCRAC